VKETRGGEIATPDTRLVKAGNAVKQLTSFAEHPLKLSESLSERFLIRQKEAVHGEKVLSFLCITFD
jgi:hypothetical protein